MAVLTNKQILDSIASTTTNSNLKDFINTHQNLEVFANSIVGDDFQIEKNALIKSIVNGISKRIVSTKIMQNKLKELKGEKLPWGSQIEEIKANPATGTPYVLNSSKLLEQNYPDVKSVYYKINRADQYPLTISDVELQKALINPTGLSDLINMSVGTLYSGDNLDEMRYTKNLITSAVLNNKVKKIIIGSSAEIGAITDPSAIMTIGTVDYGTSTSKNEQMKLLVSKMRELYYNFAFGNSLYNGYSSVKAPEEKDLTTACEGEDQILLLRTDILSTVDTELLATAFNMDKTSFMQKVIPIDDFNGLDVIALLCDKAWFRIQDTFYGLREFQNGSNLTTNYWLHHQEIMSYNLLSNAVVFIKATDKTLHNV
jgi:hypothetical protein